MCSTFGKYLPFLLAILSSAKSFVADDSRDVLQNSNLGASFAALQIQNLLDNDKFDSLKLSEKCTKDLTSYRTGIQNQVVWAMKMLDASSKVPAGIFEGNLMDLGNYDECVGINYAKIQGRHCTYTMSLDDNNVPLILRPTTSFCLPASCDVTDLEHLVNSSTAMQQIFEKSRISPGYALCSKTEPLNWTWPEILSIALLATATLFIVFCTILDILYSPQMKKKGFLNAAHKFSMITNARRIFSTESSPNLLPALRGIRVISMLWVFLAHQFIFGLITPSVNSVELIEWMTSKKSTYFFISAFSVDTFFTVSGFLLSYLFLNGMAKGNKFNIFLYYIHRYLRLTPPVIVLLILVMYLFPRTGSGPGWTFISNYFSDSCHQHWWAILLYVQNTVNKGNVCLAHTWYLAVEMQLFWISPLILLPLRRKPKMGLAILGLLLLMSIVATMLIFTSDEYANDIYEPRMTFNITLYKMFEFYAVTYIRIAPWLIGIYLGYEMSTNKPRKFNKIESGFFWFLTMMAFGFCIYGSHLVRETARSHNVIFKTIYVGLTKALWGSAIAWIIYACANGYGGIVNRILSLPIFLPLSRISYTFYLVNVGMHTIRFATTRTPVHFSEYSILSVLLWDIVMSFVCAVVFNLLFESPIIVLEKMIFSKNHKEKSESSKKQCLDNSEHQTESTKKEI